MQHCLGLQAGVEMEQRPWAWLGRAGKSRVELG